MAVVKTCSILQSRKWQLIVVNLCRHLPNHSQNGRINSPKYVPLLWTNGTTAQYNDYLMLMPKLNPLCSQQTHHHHSQLALGLHPVSHIS